MVSNQGHNQPPIYDDAKVAELQAKVSAFTAQHEQRWTKEPVDTDAVAAQANDFLTGLRDLEKEIEAERKAQKEPHLEAGRQIDRVFKEGLGAKISFMMSAIKSKLTDHARKKKEAQRIAAQKAADEAEAARRAAEEAAQDDDAEVIARAAAEADAAEKRAKAAASQKTNIGSASGLGRTAALRTSYETVVTNPKLAFMSVHDDAGVIEAIRKAHASRAAEARKVGREYRVAGVEIRENQKVA